MRSYLSSNIDFMRYRNVFATVSIVLVIVSCVTLTVLGIPLGLDFSGGVLVELRFVQPPDIEVIRQLLFDAGYENAKVQYFGSQIDVVVRLAASFGDADAGNIITNAISLVYPQVDVLRVDFVGAQVGDELLEQGGIGVLLALIAMMVYVALRFQFKFAIGALLALFHDVLLVLLVLSVLQVNFDLAVLAAVMTVVGYSLNDSLVISDHIREKVIQQQHDDILQAINASLNQVLWRTINTSVTTLLVTLTLLVFGGETIRGFALSLSVGVVVGTYSSIYVLCSVLFAMKLRRQEMVVIELDNDNKNVI